MKVLALALVFYILKKYILVLHDDGDGRELPIPRAEGEHRHREVEAKESFSCWTTKHKDDPQRPIIDKGNGIRS
jgi:hypothetical protein